MRRLGPSMMVRERVSPTIRVRRGHRLLSGGLLGNFSQWCAWYPDQFVPSLSSVPGIDPRQMTCSSLTIHSIDLCQSGVISSLKQLVTTGSALPVVLCFSHTCLGCLRCRHFSYSSFSELPIVPYSIFVTKYLLADKFNLLVYIDYKILKFLCLIINFKLFYLFTIL